MNVRAILFDIYGTLLEVGPPPVDAEALWESLWQDQLKTNPRLSLADFAATCDRIIAREHAAARAQGIAYPEVFWPYVACEAVPELTPLSDTERDDFLFRQAQIWHTVRLMPGADDLLHWLCREDVHLGIVSNAQPYTLRELDVALAGAGLSRDIFTPLLCFWSFAYGFSKPDPHVFRLLTARLRAEGIPPAETVLVGDRMDNDIEPAEAHDWRTWLLASPGDGTNSGDWMGLRRRLEVENAAPRRA